MLPSRTFLLLQFHWLVNLSALEQTLLSYGQNSWSLLTSRRPCQPHVLRFSPNITTFVITAYPLGWVGCSLFLATLLRWVLVWPILLAFLSLSSHIYIPDQTASWRQTVPSPSECGEGLYLNSAWLSCLAQTRKSWNNWRRKGGREDGKSKKVG